MEIAISVVIACIASFAANIQHKADGTPRDMIVMVPVAVATYLAITYSTN